jgi:hypothetical protein
MLSDIVFALFSVKMMRQRAAGGPADARQGPKRWGYLIAMVHCAARRHYIGPRCAGCVC